MKSKIDSLAVYERAQREGRFIVDNNATVRQAASALHVSKSTVHKDITQVLEGNHDPLAKEVRKVLDKNGAERHIRGGEATKQKFMQKRYTK